jgi:hypothetical protein
LKRITGKLDEISRFEEPKVKPFVLMIGVYRENTDAVPGGDPAAVSEFLYNQTASPNGPGRR